MKQYIYWKAITLLYLIHTTSSLSTQSSPSSSSSSSSSQFPPRDARIPPQSGSAPVPTSTDPTKERRTGGGDLFTEVIIPRKPKPKKRKRPSPSAPVVDSALLRFLANQKLEGKETAAVEVPEVLQQAQQQQVQTADSWLGQFNSNRVARLLMSCKVDETTALKTGQIVQDHVLARTARRRVRDFLKKRDVEWVQSNNNNDNNGVVDVNVNAAADVDDSDDYEYGDVDAVDSVVAAAAASSLSAFPDYGLQDVINLLLDFGLTGKDIAAILTQSPSVALMMPRRTTTTTTTTGGVPQQQQQLKREDDDVGGETLEETMIRAFDGVLLETLQLRRYDARKVLRTCPGLLTLKGSKRAANVVTLMTSLGVSVSAIAREKAALPVLLSRAPSGMFRLVAFLASDAVRMGIQGIGPLLRRKECVELLNVVAPVPGMDEPSSSSANDMNDKISSKVWSRNSELRRDRINDVYRNMTKTAWTLRNQIGTEDLGKVVSAYPSVLLLDAETQILPAAAYLMNELGIFEDDLPKVLQLYPILLVQRREDMERNVNYLKSLGVEDESLPSMFRAFPALLTMDIENTMMPVVNFLNEIGIVNVGKFITRLPPVLGYSVERELRPKWEYLAKVCLYPSFELSSFPAYFSYPLDRVIKTRYEYLQFMKEAPTQLLALDLVVRYGDRDFAEKVAKDTDYGRMFVRFAKRRKEARAKKANLKREEALAKKSIAQPPPTMRRPRPREPENKKMP